MTPASLPKVLGVATALALALGSASFFVSRSFIPEPAPKAQQASEEHDHGNDAAFEEAKRRVSQLRDSVEKAPSDYGILLRYANALYDVQKFDLAKAKYEEYLKHDPSNADVRVDYAYSIFQLGNVEQAIAESKKAIQFKKDHAVAHFNIGVMMFVSSDTLGARTWLAKSAELAPNSLVSQRAVQILSFIDSVSTAGRQ